uniref:Uncharacterized protein n=1 Tax=Sus scrofa TaxID=9823 RepID=A0A8W4FH86_PIG
MLVRMWEKRKPSCTVDGNVNWCSHCGKEWKFLENLKAELPYDPAILQGTSISCRCGPKKAKKKKKIAF